MRQAHQMIEVRDFDLGENQISPIFQAQTCIRFQAAESKPNSDFLFYIKVATPTLYVY